MRRSLPTFLAALLLGSALTAESSAPARVETVPFKSALLGTSLPYQVILPADYAASPSARYPVLYLLHGLSDHASTWIERTNVVEHAAAYRLIIVAPEGNNGWYTDSAIVPSERYESYLLEELVPDVQRRFRTIEEGYARGIAGLSMGGYGALKMALKHPDEFAFAASMSGALNAARFTAKDSGGWDLVEQSIQRAFGPVDSPTRTKNDLSGLLHAMESVGRKPFPYLYLDCGTEDAFVEQSRAFTGLLLEKQIAHEYHQVPGVHNWELWDRRIREVLAVAAAKLPRR
jgi:S-formylglutathione hydrolase FrmB